MPRRRLLEASIYSDLLAKLEAGESFAQMATVAAQYAMSTLGADGASVTRADGHELVYEAALGSVRGALRRRIPVASSFTGQVFAEGQAVLFSPDQAGSQSVERAAKDRVASGIIAPVIVAGSPVGTIGVASAEKDWFDAEDVLLLTELGRFLSIAMKIRYDWVPRDAESADTVSSMLQ